MTMVTRRTIQGSADGSLATAGTPAASPGGYLGEPEQNSSIGKLSWELET
jgi:hypothetical protein